VRIGRYADAARANSRALAVDERYFARNGRGGQYEIYRAHDAHFLAYAHMLAGRAADALAAARGVLSGLTFEELESMASTADGFFAVPLHVLVRFGRYEEVIDEPEPPAFLPGSVATWRFARALAANALGRADMASEERQRFAEARAAVPAEATFDLNRADAVLAVAELLLDGEIAYRAGRVDEGLALLRRAAEAEDALHYAEPPGWMMPVRHSLGALLLEAGRVAEAEAVYRADLGRNPVNGWALHGLAECLRRGGHPDAFTVESLFRKAWAGADTELYASCFCRRKPEG
jgi:tetratricopeptide (TPR) repeat protein